MNRVAVFGTFDIFHPGHTSFLKQAKKQSDYLLAIVARDINVEKVKGTLPTNFETKRGEVVRQQKIADKVVLGSKTHNYFRTLRTYKIDKIVLGYDQKPTIFELRKQLKRHRLPHVTVTRVRAYNPSKFKSSKLLNNV
ncbi:MAG TPA: adenylyltransferase/cytidyltransferase family protein [Candidatus Saccharimonadales bacterium]|nr:adenylyltransferase/cytidyltransferase family protein [Candidatus Saccharimonadales bacterium]